MNRLTTPSATAEGVVVQSTNASSFQCVATPTIEAAPCIRCRIFPELVSNLLRPMPITSPQDALANPHVIDALSRGIMRIGANRITYALNQERSYDWSDPEEWVRAVTIAWLVIDRDYPAARLRTEVVVPRRTPSDSADIVVYLDDACRDPYLVVENKAHGQSQAAQDQGIEQLFGNANSLRAPVGLYDDSGVSFVFDVANHPPTERRLNRLGPRAVLPKQYGQIPQYLHIAGQAGDIAPLASSILETRIRRAHALIWAGGKRDPLTAFDEWSKLLFAKVADERTTPTGSPRRFQKGTNETTAAVANRVHKLFMQARRDDPSIFPEAATINVPDGKIADVVTTLQDVSFTRTDIDSIGQAFEQFFGSIFRGGLGQYFTMRQLARFTVGLLEVTPEDYVLDPTAGSGGFLLEVLLQTWHHIDAQFAGQPPTTLERLRFDFALQHVYGIEIHEILARICKINLLLHHDGHTNIEAGATCLDTGFKKDRLNPPREKFSVIVGNPPFGDEVKERDDDKLGANELESFSLAYGRKKVDSEQLIIERAIDLLEPGGRFGLILPDGVLNNQGELSNCPRTRRLLATRGRIEAIVSLPDYAFRKSGAQNKTSIVFFRKFSRGEARNFEREYATALAEINDEGRTIAEAFRRSELNYPVFLAEANFVGYTPSGQESIQNDLFRTDPSGSLAPDQSGTILGEWREFQRDVEGYAGRVKPDTMTLPFDVLWLSHPSNRLDPKYHLFQREAMRPLPEGWIRVPIREVMQRRNEEIDPSANPDRRYTVMTIAQTGEIRPREAGKGKNPPEWLGTYLEDMPSRWFAARSGDLAYSSIDLWKGCIAVVPPEFDGALATKEFPIYEVIDHRLDPAFLQCLLRSRYYQRAFRAITTGHSNRRRTQSPDFEALEIAFPSDRDEQKRLVREIMRAREDQRGAAEQLKTSMMEFSDSIDGRGDEDLPDVEPADAEASGSDD